MPTTSLTYFTSLHFTISSGARRQKQRPQPHWHSCILRQPLRVRYRLARANPRVTPGRVGVILPQCVHVSLRPHEHFHPSVHMDRDNRQRFQIGRRQRHAETIVTASFVRLGEGKVEVDGTHTGMRKMIMLRECTPMMMTIRSFAHLPQT